MWHAIFVKTMLLLVLPLDAKLKVEDYEQKVLGGSGEIGLESLMNGLSGFGQLSPELEKQLLDSLKNLKRNQEETLKFMNELEKEM